MIRTWLRLAAGLALLAAAGCSWVGGGPLVLRMDGEARAFQALAVGQTMVLDVRNPGSGGYDFGGTSFDPAVLRMDSHVLEPPRQARPGDFGRATFTFTALAPGRTDVVVKIHRPWEKDRDPEIYKTVEVRVTDEGAPPPAKTTESAPAPPPEPGDNAKKSGWLGWLPWF